MSMEDLRTQMVGHMQGAAVLQLSYVGIVAGLFEALHDLGQATPELLATRTGKDPGYVMRWCDAAYAFGLVDEAGEEGVFALTQLGSGFRPSAPGTLMPFAVGAVLGAHMMERTAELISTGERPGEKVLAERATVLPWFGPMLEAQFGPFFESHILKALPAYRKVDERGGLAVDLGCGNGWYLRRLAQRFPRIRGVGLDAFEQSIAGATRLALSTGLSARLDFRRGDLHDFTVEEPADLIAMNRALHHVWDEKENVFRILAEHLAPGGWAVIWEPAWPKNRTPLREPGMRPMAFQNLAEHVQGNHFLRPDEVAEGLRTAGLEPEIHLFAEGKEAVITGWRRT